jgi:hypothetical protein
MAMFISHRQGLHAHEMLMWEAMSVWVGHSCPTAFDLASDFVLTIGHDGENYAEANSGKKI